MIRIHPERADSDPSDHSLAADVLLRQEPDEEEDEEEDEGDGKEDDDSRDAELALAFGNLLTDVCGGLLNHSVPRT